MSVTDLGMLKDMETTEVLHKMDSATLHVVRVSAEREGDYGLLEMLDEEEDLRSRV